MRLSVLMITYNRAEQLTRCLDSLFKQFSSGLGEVLVYVNGEDGLTVKTLTEKSKEYPCLRFFQGQRLSRGAARNNLLKQAAEEIICFLDDDVVVADGSIPALLTAVGQNPRMAIFGGPNLCFPESDLFQIGQSQVLGSFLGTAWMSRRYQQGRDIVDADERVLTLCNLAIRRDALFQDKVIFHEKFISCEENLLLRQMLARGLKALFLSQFIVFHERRRSYSELCRQMFQYGQGRMQTIRIAPARYDFIFFLPPLFFLYLVLLPVLFIIPNGLLPLALYFCLTGFMAVKFAYQHRCLKFIPLTFMIFFLVHTCYGAGFLFELFFPKK